MKNRILLLTSIITLSLKIFSQPCGVAQILSPSQQTQINTNESLLDSALKYENLTKIDSLSAVIKNIYGVQAGRPENTETFYALVSNINWINLTNAVTLSRQLIANDSLVYVNLWKTAKGMKPPLYQPHSLFLRASAELASGLLKISDKETDITRKNLYKAWAMRALDSLATMQLPNGAFPFPDLRPYGDPTFGPIIQNFMFYCGADSVNVLQNGFIVSDKNTGEYKFDAGVIANAYFEAYQYTGKVSYKNIAISIGNYLKPLKFNLNYNYNTFASLGLTRAYQLTNDTSYLNRAIKNIRYCVYPGQISNGRWADGHNANSRYHSVIIQNIVPTINLIPASHPYKSKLDSMAYNAVKNLVRYSYTCNSATGYRWLMKGLALNIPQTLKDSIKDLIGKHINQSTINGKYLDIPTMGEYLELLGFVNGLHEITFPLDLKVNLYPNPTTGITNLIYEIKESDDVYIFISDMNGKQVKVIDQSKKTKGTYSNQMDLTDLQNGIYFLTLKVGKKKYTEKIIKID
jgi:hypothetical protein